MLDSVFDLIVILIGLFITFMIHEVGHLVGGKISGFKFNSFSIGLMYFYKKNSKLKFKVRKLTLFNILSGHCQMIPEQGFKSFNPFWFNLGGSFFNLLTTFILFIVIENIEINHIWLSWIRPGMVMNLIIGLGNLIPLKILQQTDGYNRIRGFYATDKRGMYIMLILDREVKNGKRYRDFDPDLLLVDLNEKINSFFVAFLVMVFAFYLADKGDHKAAIKELNRLDLKKLLIYEM